ncbi:cache domain-containing protein [Roseateles amylovorans]|uniref:Cache domain-containing protein n=1 Tax=Roseateles amylovorans TaxID=2978473 RepID=A0ABY6B6K5_9BURK|nr:cache domain-containing protein [Roseateles amylovorans]UXH80462.1 cache domain-containing protein [Roseateles amylovorans]
MKLRLRLKILLLAILPLVASLLLIAMAVRQQERALLAREHAAVQRTYMEARRDELRHYVELAVSTLQPLYLHDKDAPPSTVESDKQEALRLLSALDYGEDGYFFVYDLQGRVLMHSRQPELQGRNLWELRDPLGRPTIQQLIAQARAGGGYVDYQWRKPSTGELAPKLGYVVAMERWNWMVGTGLYLDGIYATLEQLDREAQANIAQTMWWIAGIAVFGVALISACALALNLSDHRVAEAKLRALAHQVVRSQEEERAHLSRELHDGVSQTLVSTKLLIESAQQAQNTVLLPRALERLNDSLTEVRRLSHRLRPALLDTLGLPAALEHLAREFDGGDEAASASVGMQIVGTPFELPELLNTVLFRVAQEALTNVVKHAQARRVEMSLEFGSTPLHEGAIAPGAVMLRVLDDGAGFDPDAAERDDPSQGIGLRNMRERLASVGGLLELQSSPGHGTQIEALVDGDAITRLARDNPVP